MRNRIILYYGLFKIIWDWLILILVFYIVIEVLFVLVFIIVWDEVENYGKDVLIG